MSCEESEQKVERTDYRQDNTDYDDEALECAAARDPHEETETGIR